jgi:hypothetical protein
MAEKLQITLGNLRQKMRLGWSIYIMITYKYQRMLFIDNLNLIQAEGMVENEISGTSEQSVRRFVCNSAAIRSSDGVCYTRCR